MYLKKIEIQGFKSFADKAVLEFMPGITSVIGPNGSGKSNISDAIRWVLGEQSMKSLRGSKSEDIIFAGTENRRSLGFAEVSIIFDNSDNRLPIDYEEVKITRKLYRSGESEYLIGGATCRLKDVQELFMDTGIGKDGYSIIGQGRIDEILSSNSAERRHIFEEAAGIVKYRVRKNESERKLENTKNNLVRIGDIILEIENNLEPLKISSEKAKQYLDLREELKKIEIGLFLDQIEKNKEKLETTTNDENILKDQLETEEQWLLKQEEEKENKKIELNNLTEEIEKTQNLSFDMVGQQEKLTSEINLSKEKINHNEENTSRLQAEIHELENKIKEIEQDKVQKQEKKERMFSSKEKFEQELKEKEEELKKINATLSKRELEIEGKKKTLEEKSEQKMEEKNNSSVLDANLENLNKREQQLKKELQDNIYELDTNKIKNEEETKRFFELENKRIEIIRRLDNIKQKKEEKNKIVSDLDSKISTITEEYRVKSSRHKYLVESEKEKEGYAKSVKEILQNSEKGVLKGIHGILANLITVDKEYETALEMCLGNSLQNIVTNTEQDAKKSIEHLRANDLGRASFLPIGAVKGKRVDINIKEIQKKHAGVIGIASDLVKFDLKYEQIVLNLLGKTVLVDNMDTGIALAKEKGYGFRIVTLKGDILNTTGQMTGGSVYTKSNSILSRTREIEELEKNIKELDKEIQKLNKQKESVLLEVQEFSNDSAIIEEELKTLDITYEVEKQKFDIKKSTDEKLQKRIETLRNEQENISIQKEEIGKNKEQIKGLISVLEQEIGALNQEINEFNTDNKESFTTVDNLNQDITNLKISLSSFYESGLGIDELIEVLDGEIANSKKSIQSKKQEILNLQKENEELKNTITTIEEDIKQLMKNSENSVGKVEELKQERIDKNKELDEIEKNTNEKRNQIQGLKEQVLKVELKKSKIGYDIESIINKMWEDYEITPNQAKKFEKPENIAETTKRVNQIKEEIKNLGNINIDSIEEYKKTKKRYDFLCEQRLDLENTSIKLKEIIEDMTMIMKKQFGEQFKLINQNFGQVFSELFDGGRAEVKLTEKDNILESGIDIEVQPPGKRLQNMLLLSGGERAFTAIALLFAILKLNPAPFCVLDEIEAALDDVNIIRFAEYIKKFSKNIQFLVITHRKGTMESADTIYGVTMEEKGISKLLSMKLK